MLPGPFSPYSQLRRVMSEYATHVRPRLQQLPGFSEMQEIEGFPGLWIGPAIAARSPTAYTTNGITHVIAANGQPMFVPSYVTPVTVIIY